MNNKQKTKRAPNYTLEEKNTLLSIVAKYQNVIDCKRTGAYFVQQKQAAWKSVVTEYNSICTTGPRDEHMLKHFYNNIKHRARKDSAIKNKRRYLEQLSVQTNEDFFLQPSTSSQAEQTVVVKVANNESKNIKKTGGGSFTPTVTENEYQILSVLDNQIHPDVNPYDEAAEYFGENVEENSKKELEQKSNPCNLYIHVIYTWEKETKTAKNYSLANMLLMVGGTRGKLRSIRMRRERSISVTLLCCFTSRLANHIYLYVN